MEAPKADLADAVKRLARASEEGLASHPEAAELVAYHRGEMAPEAATELQAHLELCRECTALLLDLAELEVEPAPPDENTEAAWEELARRLPGSRPDSPATVPQPAMVMPISRPASWLPRPALALAAALLASLLVSVPWILRLRQTMETLSQPQWGAPVLDLSARQNLRADDPPDAGEPQAIELAPDHAVFTLVLHPTGSPQYPGYHGRILDAEGRELSNQAITQNEFGAFVVTLSRQALPAGVFRIEISGVAESGRIPIDTFALYLAPAPTD